MTSCSPECAKAWLVEGRIVWGLIWDTLTGFGRKERDRAGWHFRVKELAVKQKWVAVGGAFALFAVGFGAFGAHGLESRLTPHLLDVFKTGAYYQMVHGLGMIVVGQRIELRPGARLLPLCFALTGNRRWAIITPVGGLAFMLAWALFTIAEFTDRQTVRP